MKAITELEVAIANAVSATEQYVSASAKVDEARREETGCLNRMNQAQKILDELIQSIKASAPRDSNWGRKSRPGEIVMADSIR